MLDPDVVALAQAANFAAFTTLGRDGQPSTHVMWVDADDEHVLINTEIHRQKAKNVARDARVAVAIWEASSAYRFVEVRGRVIETIGGQAARDHIDRLSDKYRGRPYDPSAIQTERVILVIEPDRQYVRGVAR